MRPSILFQPKFAYGVGFALALAGCNTPVTSPRENASADPVPAGRARVSGTLRDSTGVAVANAAIHAFTGGNDSTEDTCALTDDGGRFKLDLHPGKARLFAEKAGRLAQTLALQDLQAGRSVDLEGVQLKRVVSGAINLPPIDGQSFSVRIEGSPLEASVSTSGKVTVSLVEGEESIVVLAFVSRSGVRSAYRLRVVSRGGVLSIQTIAEPTPTNPVPSVQGDTLILSTADARMVDAGIIGSLDGGPSRWTNTNFGGRLDQGIGGAWDGATVGRLLWRFTPPEVLSGREILSAKLVYQTLHWGIRPHGGKDLVIEGYKLLKPWKEGRGPGQEGYVVSADLDGASARGPMFGVDWNRILVGLDDIDAQSVPSVRATLPYLSLAGMELDVTRAVRGWIADPSSNDGMVFRSINENDGLYLDYPGFASCEYPEVSKRPYLKVVLAPEAARK